MKEDQEFRTWLKEAMCHLFGDDIDLYADKELWILFQRAERLHEKNGKTYRICDMLTDYHENHWSKGVK